MTVLVRVHSINRKGEIDEVDVNPTEIVMTIDADAIATSHASARTCCLMRGDPRDLEATRLWLVEDRDQLAELIALAQLHLARREAIEVVEIHNRNARAAPTFHCRFRG